MRNLVIGYIALFLLALDKKPLLTCRMYAAEYLQFILIQFRLENPHV